MKPKQSPGLKMRFGNQKGMSMLLVLTFLILAGVTSMGIYTAAKRAMKRSNAQAEWQTADEAVKAGVASAKAWITNDGLDAVGIMQAFYDKYAKDSVMVPIKLPLDSLKIDDTFHQGFEVYLTSLNAEVTPIEITIEVVGKGKDNSLTSMSYAFRVEGLYLDKTEITTYAVSPIFNQEYGLFNAGEFNAMNSGISVVGSVYGGKNIETNGQAPITIIGDLLIGGVEQGSYYNAPLTVTGNYFATIPYFLNSGAPIHIMGNAWFKGGIKYVDADIKVDGNMIVDGDAFQSGNGQGGKITVGLDAWYRDNGALALKTPSNYFGDLIIERDLFIQNPGSQISVTKNTYSTKAIYNSTSPGTDFSFSGKAFINYVTNASNLKTVLPNGVLYDTPKSNWSSNVNYTPINYPDLKIFDYLKEKLDPVTLQHPDPLKVDGALVEGSMLDWSVYRNFCGSACGNNTFDAKNLNGFYDSAPDSVKLITKDQDGNDVEWIVIRMSGLYYNGSQDANERLRGNFIMIFDNGGANFNNNLPLMESTSRAMYWFKNGADANGMGLIKPGNTCYCVVIAESGSEIQLKGTQTWKGGFYAMNGAHLASNGGVDTFDKAQDIFKDFAMAGLVTQTGSTSTTSSQDIEIDKALRVTAPKLSLKLMGAFKQINNLEERIAEDEEDMDAKKKVFLSIYPNIVRVEKGAYTSFDELKDGMNIKALYSYDSEKGDDNNIANSPKKCTGEWAGYDDYTELASIDTTVEYTYKVNCPDHSTTRKAVIIIGTGAGAADKSSSSGANSSSSLSQLSSSSRVVVSSSSEVSSSSASTVTLYTYKVTPSPIGSAVVECDMGGIKYADKCIGAAGSSVIFTVTPNEGYKITKWSDLNIADTIRYLTIEAGGKNLTVDLNNATGESSSSGSAVGASYSNPIIGYTVGDPIDLSSGPVYIKLANIKNLQINNAGVQFQVKITACGEVKSMSAENWSWQANFSSSDSCGDYPFVYKIEVIGGSASSTVYAGGW